MKNRDGYDLKQELKEYQDQKMRRMMKIFHKRFEKERQQLKKYAQQRIVECVRIGKSKDECLRLYRPIYSDQQTLKSAQGLMKCLNKAEEVLDFNWDTKLFSRSMRKCVDTFVQKTYLELSETFKKKYRHFIQEKR